MSNVLHQGSAVSEKEEFKQPYWDEYDSLEEIENIFNVDIMSYTGNLSVVHFKDEDRGTCYQRKRDT
jgi:hypothetical protein